MLSLVISKQLYFYAKKTKIFILTIDETLELLYYWIEIVCESC